MSNSLTITLGGPVPVSIAFNPPVPIVPDNAPAGTLVCEVIVTMSDGSAFAGDLSLTSSPPNNMLTWDLT